MTDLYQYSGNRLLFARRDGKVVLDTADRMPATTGQLVVTRNVVWPRPPGERLDARFTSGGNIEFRWITPAGEASFTVDLGPAPADYTPNFVLARIKGARAESTNIFGFIYAVPQIRPGKWRQVNAGSVYIEQLRTSNPELPISNRHMSFAIEGGRWVLRCRHSSRGYTTSWSSGAGGGGSQTSIATWTFQIAMAWGVFDL